MRIFKILLFVSLKLIAANQFITTLSSNPISFFPPTIQDYYSATVAAHFFETLCDRHWETHEWMPLIARKWEESPDGKSYTFWIDQKAKFWDGSSVTPEDVKFSFDVFFMDEVESWSQRSAYNTIEKAEVLDKERVRFTVKTVYFKNFFSLASLYVFKKDHILKLYAKDKTLAKAATTSDILGTGPWKLKDWKPNQRVELTRYEKYWNKKSFQKQGKWNFKEWIYQIIFEPSVALEALKKGDISYTRLSSKQWYIMEKQSPKGVVRVKAQNKIPKNYSFIGWNYKNPLFQDKRVRKALSHLVNLKVWNDKFDFGLSEAAISPYGPKSIEHNPDLEPIDFNLDKARDLLTQAGWVDTDSEGYLIKDNKRFEFTILYAAQAKQRVEYKFTEFKNKAEKVGILIHLKSLEWSGFVKVLDGKNFDAVSLSWTRSVDPDLRQIFHSESIQGSNFISYSNKEVDKLIDQFQVTLDESKRLEISRNLEKLIYDDQPYTFLQEDKYDLYAHRDHILKKQDSFSYALGEEFWKQKAITP